MRAGVVLLLLCSACGSGLQDYAHYLDLRTVAIISDPPELLSDGPIPLDVSVYALVVDPRGGPLQYTWSFCPVQSDSDCNDFETQLQGLDANTQTALRNLRSLQVTGTAVPTTSELGSPVLYSVPNFNVSNTAEAAYGHVVPSGDGNTLLDLTAFLWGYFAETSLFNQGQGAWPSVRLDLVSSHGDTLHTTRRLVLGVLDFAVLAGPLAQRFGITLCPPTGAQPAGCLALPNHAPNANPLFDTVQWSVSPNGPWANAKTGITLKGGGSVYISPTFTAASYETYTSINADLQNQTLSVQTLEEELAVSWFCASCTLLNDLTWPKYTTSLINIYTAPSTVPTVNQGVDIVYLVGRDMRGGETYVTVPVTITP